MTQFSQMTIRITVLYTHHLYTHHLKIQCLYDLYPPATSIGFKGGGYKGRIRLTNNFNKLFDLIKLFDFVRLFETQ